MKNWEKTEYQTIINASIEDGVLKTKFANGDEISINPNLLMPGDILNKFKNQTISYSPYEVNIPLEDDIINIPWDRIRVLSDKDFARFLAEKAEENAKLIGIKIKRLRERSGIKSMDLSERSGISAQTISRIEKGHQDVSFSTLKKLLASMGYSLKDLANEELPITNEEEIPRTLPILLKRLSKVGIDPSFVTKKIIPQNLQNELAKFQNGQPDLLLNEAASYLSKIYGWNVNDIWSQQELQLDQSLIGSTLFKKSIKANSNQVKAYLPYANYLANTVLKACVSNTSREFPEDIDEFKSILHSAYGGLNLDSILRYSWDMGICVIPLNDSGIFHGAAWKIHSRPVIILKQKVASHAKWIFDLLHELYHVFDHLKDNDFILESNEISPLMKGDDIQEREANSFASQVIFSKDPEKFVQEAVSYAEGKTENLKIAVKQVALNNNLRVDCLANYIAHRLDHQGSNWWATADSLQEKEPDPYLVTKYILLQKIDVSILGTLDHNLLSTALNI